MKSGILTAIILGLVGIIFSFDSLINISQAQASCPGAPEPRMVVGGVWRVAPGDANNVRSGAGTDYRRIGQIPGGGEFLVLDGPVCADGYAWWQIDYDGLVGWTAEGTGNTYWTEPVRGRSVPTQTPMPPTQPLPTQLPPTTVAERAMPVRVAQVDIPEGAIVVDDSCSLHNAIKSANMDSAQGGCQAGNGDDIIVLTGDVTLTEINAQFTNSYAEGGGGTAAVTTNIVVEGNGFTVNRPSSAPNFRLFFVDRGGRLTLRNMTLSGGHPFEPTGGGDGSGSGGALFNSGGFAQLQNVHITGNTSPGSGQAVFSDGGWLDMTDVTISANDTEREGIDSAIVTVGAGRMLRTRIIDNEGIGLHVRQASGFGRVVMLDSEISGNREGIHVVGTLKLYDSLIANNVGSFYGSRGGISVTGTLYLIRSSVLNNRGELHGGVSINGSLYMVNSTVAGNQAERGTGGVYASVHGDDAIILLNNTIVDNMPFGVYLKWGGGGHPTGQYINNVIAQNGTADCGFDETNAVMDNTYDGDGSCLDAPTVAGFGTAPADNGGPVPSVALSAGSPLIDSANVAYCPVTDGRGAPRVGQCDVGAFEFGSEPGTPYAITEDADGVLFTETFDDNSRAWDVGSERGVDASIINGGYRLSYPETNQRGDSQMWYTVPLFADTGQWLVFDGEYDISVDVSEVVSDHIDPVFRIYFGMEDPILEYLAFSLEPHKNQWSLFHRGLLIAEGNPEPRMPIPRESDAYTITVQVREDFYTLLINGEVIGRGIAEVPAVGAAGFGGGYFDGGYYDEVSMVFDNFTVVRPGSTIAVEEQSSRADLPQLVIEDGLVELLAFPASDAEVLDLLYPQSVPITGINADGTYLFVDTGEISGWVAFDISTNISGDVTSLPILDPDELILSAEAEEFNALPQLVIESDVNVLSLPDDSAVVMDTVSNTRLAIIGLNEDGTFFFVDLDGEYGGDTGWIRASVFTTVDGDLSGVPILDPNDLPDDLTNPEDSTDAGSVLDPLADMDPEYRPRITLQRAAFLLDAPAGQRIQQDPVIGVTLPITGFTIDGSYLRVIYEDREAFVFLEGHMDVEGNLSRAPNITYDPTTAPINLPYYIGYCSDTYPIVSAAENLPTNDDIYSRLVPGTAEAWTFEGRAGAQWSIEMHGTIDGFMELIGPDGTGLAYADDSLFDDYVEQPMIHSYTLPSDGTYTVVVCGYGQDEYGDYRLSTFVYGDIATAPIIEVTIPPDESGFIIIGGKRVDLTNEETIESYGLRFAYPDDWSVEVFSNTLDDGTTIDTGGMFSSFTESVQYSVYVYALPSPPGASLESMLSEPWDEEASAILDAAGAILDGDTTILDGRELIWVRRVLDMGNLISVRVAALMRLDDERVAYVRLFGTVDTIGQADEALFSLMNIAKSLSVAE